MRRASSASGAAAANRKDSELGASSVERTKKNTQSDLSGRFRRRGTMPLHARTHGRLPRFARRVRRRARDGRTGRVRRRARSAIRPVPNRSITLGLPVLPSGHPARLIRLYRKWESSARNSNAVVPRVAFSWRFFAVVPRWTLIFGKPAARCVKSEIFRLRWPKRGQCAFLRIIWAPISHLSFAATLDHLGDTGKYGTRRAKDQPERRSAVTCTPTPLRLPPGRLSTPWMKTWRRIGAGASRSSRARGGPSQNRSSLYSPMILTRARLRRRPSNSP